jgi:hypothetical protein
VWYAHANCGHPQALRLLCDHALSELPAQGPTKIMNSVSKEGIHHCAAELSESSCAQMSWSATGPFFNGLFLLSFWCCVLRASCKWMLHPSSRETLTCVLVMPWCHLLAVLFLPSACWFSAFEYNQPAHTRLIPVHHSRSIHLYRASDTTQSQTRHEKIERCAQPHSPLPCPTCHDHHL